MSELELLTDIREILIYVLLVLSCIWGTNLIKLFRR